MDWTLRVPKIVAAVTAAAIVDDGPVAALPEILSSADLECHNLARGNALPSAVAVAKPSERSGYRSSISFFDGEAVAMAETGTDHDLAGGTVDPAADTSCLNRQHRRPLLACAIVVCERSGSGNATRPPGDRHSERCSCALAVVETFAEMAIDGFDRVTETTNDASSLGCQSRSDPPAIDHSSGVFLAEVTSDLRRPVAKQAVESRVPGHHGRRRDRCCCGDDLRVTALD